MDALLMFILLIVNFIVVALGVAILSNAKTRQILGIGKRGAEDKIKEMAAIKEKLETIDKKLIEYENFRIDFLARIDSLSNNISSLTIRINTLEANVNKLATKELSSISTKDKSLNREPESSKETVTVTKYVQQCGTDGFNADSLLDNLTKFTKFIIRIKGDKATYEVPDLEECQSKLLNGYASISPLVEEVARVNSPVAIMNDTPGILKLEGARWIIESKLKIKLI